ncbi:hypothetical protein KUTeg_003017 [Tegillarca granosa]|uniref:Uncharacterized protein n=1 Tax=Tegillarca granosa TaxID=220873 RepID=A0ABQ9FMI0_TEGGR|nr:hypothetical protein KUTeg_003017 [Tegillarca granosa]
MINTNIEYRDRALDEDDKDEEIITGISLFGKLGVAASIALCCLITVETFPTTVRCMGVSVGFICGIFGCAVGRQFYLTFTQNFHYMIPYIGYGISMTSVGISALVFKETSNIPLSDVLPSRHRMIGMKDVTRLINEFILVLICEDMFYIQNILFQSALTKAKNTLLTPNFWQVNVYICCSTKCTLMPNVQLGHNKKLYLMDYEI